MALTILPNQALGTNASGSFCGNAYCNPVQTNDTYYIEGKVTRVNDVNLVDDGEFNASTNWTLGAGFSISGGKLHASNISGTSADTIAPVGFIQDRLYLIHASFVVTGGSAGANQGWQLRVNDVNMKTPDGTAYNQTANYYWFYIPSSITTDDIKITTNENTIDFDVNFVRVYEMSMAGGAIYQDNNIVLDVPEVGENYFENGGGDITEPHDATGISEDDIFLWFISEIAWGDSPELGCITPVFYDSTIEGANRIRNGNFDTNLSYWESSVVFPETDLWSWSGNHALYSAPGAGLYTPQTLSQSLSITGGLIYTLVFTFAGFSGGNRAHVYYSINGGAPVDGGSFTNGTDSISIDLSSYSGAVTLVVLFGESIPQNDSFTLDTVSLTASTHSQTLAMNCVNIQENHANTILFKATNNDNAFGFNYVDGYLEHNLRVYAKMKYSGYPEETQQFLFSDNSTKLLFARSEKEFEITIGDAGEYIHDCLRMMRLNDTFTVDGEEIVAQGTYDLKQRKSSDNSQAIFHVKNKEGISSNYSCS